MVLDPKNDFNACHGFLKTVIAGYIVAAACMGVSNRWTGLLDCHNFMHSRTSPVLLLTLLVLVEATQRRVSAYVEFARGHIMTSLSFASAVHKIMAPKNVPDQSDVAYMRRDSKKRKLMHYVSVCPWMPD